MANITFLGTGNDTPCYSFITELPPNVPVPARYVELRVNRHCSQTSHAAPGRLSRRRSIPTRIVMALVPYSFYLFALSLIPLPESLITTIPGLLSIALSRLIVLGTFIIGLLSGLGAARNAWDHMPIFSRKRRYVVYFIQLAISLICIGRRMPTEQDIQTAEEALERIRNDIVVRRKEERRLQSTKVFACFTPSFESLTS